jgi:catechol 2,3-dioxygenase-like lactoylglutathione lyase family enzyme
MTVLRLSRVERIVSSLDVARFYQDALGFEVFAAINDSDRRTIDLRLGQQRLRLIAVDRLSAAYPLDSTAADLWFQHIAVVTDDIDTAYSQLVSYGQTAISKGGPQKLPPNAGSVTAYKFRDPDGHPVELIQFPASKTIGIDHSAISVSDANKSIAFYRDVLGMALASRQINQGTEQEALDGLADDIVEVIALEPLQDKTPHIELLAYHTPQSRRYSYAANDIAADRLVLQVDDLNVILKQLNSYEKIQVDGNKAALIRDPDGHFLVLTEAATL